MKIPKGSKLEKALGRTKKKREEGELSKKFRMLWKVFQGPELKPEHQFHPTRKWKFDFAIPEIKFAVEIEGGIWMTRWINRRGKKVMVQGGRHNSGAGLIADYHKYNAAELDGWTVIKLAEGMVTADAIEELIEWVNKRIYARKLNGGS
jgi:phage/plasmid primase-like uncharacterized protein